ncbi:MAG: sigma-70 family RNA polymerase sigma factor [Planctomycetaceae bacterium]|nr:sigma-70 family RNA polymerase sigma factor [Planctomycetales bacterium]MCB9925513.1 sigma-70 family RNA polymerase sigma factor [Planctomycetaceae bacterium]
MLEGDDSYRKLLVEHAYGRLRVLVKKRLSLFPGVQRWEQTDDVLQQASMRLLKSLEAVKPRTVREFFGLAATQIRRTLIDLARHYGGKQGIGAKHATNERQGDKGREQPDTPDATSDPETLAEWTEFHQKVEVLPKEQRDVFDLLYYNGVTQPEAAQILGVSERTLKRRWRETRQAIYKAMHGNESRA